MNLTVIWMPPPWATQLQATPKVKPGEHIFNLLPGDRVAPIDELGIVVRREGETMLFGVGTPGHPIELDALNPQPSWQDVPRVGAP